MNSIINFLETKKFSQSHLQGFVNDLLFSIKSWYEFLEKEQFFSFATIVDVRFKVSDFQDSNKVEMIKNRLALEMTSLSKESHPTKTDTFEKCNQK